MSIRTSSGRSGASRALKIACVEDAQRRLWAAQSHFAVLQGWDIGVVDATPAICGCVDLDPVTRTATVYAWPANKPEPEDFILHELLHVAVKAVYFTPDEYRHDAEEALVQDMCALSGLQSYLR